MGTLLKDLRFAVRVMRRNLLVTTLAIGSLALGIAGNTIIFSLVDGMLYRPLPYEEPDRLALVGEWPKGTPATQLSPSSAANFLDWRRRQTSFEGIHAMRLVPVILDSGGEREQVKTMSVTPGTFSMLEAPTVRGRQLAPDEGLAGNHRVVILSHQFWSDRYGDGADPVGDTLRLNGEPYKVIGVMNEEFEFLDPNILLYTPLVLDPAEVERGVRDISVVARLAPGVDFDTARAEMTSIMQTLEREYPDANRGYTVSVFNLREWFPDPRNRQLLVLLQGGMLFVLLIACANIANLLLARSQHRHREIAVRTSLGASRGQILRQLFTENMLMALIAGALGFLVAAVGVDVIAKALAGVLPKAFAPEINGRILLFNLALTVVGGFLFGLMPVLQTRRLDLVDSLKAGSRGTGSPGSKRLLSKGLVVAELTLALIFLGGASVLLSSFQVLRNDDPGFGTEGLLVGELILPETRFGTDRELTEGVGEMTRRLAAIPGASGATVSNSLPRTVQIPRTVFTRTDRPPDPEQAPPSTFWLAAHTDYFDTLEIPVLSGRAFTVTDDPEGAPVAIVNRALAEQHWPDESPLGRYLTVMGASREIVGVVGDTKPILTDPKAAPPVLYLPWAQRPDRVLAVVVRGASAGDLTEPVRQEILGFAPNAVVVQLLPLDDYLEQFWVGTGVIGTLLRAFGFLALVLAAMGIYGILAYSVARRSHEIGVRMAIGAERSGILKMVLREGMVLAAIGVLLGIPGVLLVKSLVSSLFDDVVPVSMVSLAIPCVVLLAVALLAGLRPARRAAATEPVNALREE